jgi:hypothetical protein
MKSFAHFAVKKIENKLMNKEQKYKCATQLMIINEQMFTKKIRKTE